MAEVWMDEPPRSRNESSSESRATVIEQPTKQIVGEIHVEPIMISKPRDPWGSASTASEPARIDDTLSTSTITTAATEDPRMYLEDDSLRGLDDPKEPPKDVKVEFFPSPPAYETLFQTAKQPNGSVETGKAVESAEKPPESKWKPAEAVNPSESTATPVEIPKLTKSAIKSVDASGETIQEAKAADGDDPNEQKKIVNISITTETTPTVKTVTFNEVPQIYSPPAPKSPEASPRKPESRSDSAPKSAEKLESTPKSAENQSDSVPKTAESQLGSANSGDSASKPEAPKSEESTPSNPEAATAVPTAESNSALSSDASKPTDAESARKPVDSAESTQLLIPTVTISPASESINKPTTDAEPKTEPTQHEDSTAAQISESAVSSAIESAAIIPVDSAEVKSTANDSTVPANSGVSAEPKSNENSDLAQNKPEEPQLNATGADSALNSAEPSAAASAVESGTVAGEPKPTEDVATVTTDSVFSSQPAAATNDFASTPATNPGDNSAPTSAPDPKFEATAVSAATQDPTASQDPKPSEPNRPEDSGKINSPTESNASESISVHLAEAAQKKPEDQKPVEAETPKPTEIEPIASGTDSSTNPISGDSQPFGKIEQNVDAVPKISALEESKPANEFSAIGSNPDASNQTVVAQDSGNQSEVAAPNDGNATDSSILPTDASNPTESSTPGALPAQGSVDASASGPVGAFNDSSAPKDVHPNETSTQALTEEAAKPSESQWVTETAASNPTVASEFSAPSIIGDGPKPADNQWVTEPAASTPAAVPDESSAPGGISSNSAEPSAPSIIGETPKSSDNQWATEPAASTPAAGSNESSTPANAASAAPASQWITESAPSATDSQSSAPAIIGDSSDNKWVTEPAASTPATASNEASAPLIIGEIPKPSENQWVTEPAASAPVAASDTTPTTQWITESAAPSSQNEPSTPKAADKPSESQWITEPAKSGGDQSSAENQIGSTPANEPSAGSGATTQWITEPATNPTSAAEETTPKSAEIPKPSESQWITETPNSNSAPNSNEPSTPKAADIPKPSESQWITEPAAGESTTKPEEAKSTKTENDEKSVAETLVSETENTFSEVKPTGGLQKSVTVTENLPNIQQIPDKKPKDETSPENESSINEDLDAYEQRLIQNTREALALVDKLCQESAERQRRRRHPSGDYQITRTTISPGTDLDVETYKVNQELLDDPIDIVMIPAARLLILDRNLGLTLFDLESKEVKRCPPDAEWRSPDCGCWLRRHKQILVVYEQKVENEYRKHLARFDADLKMLTKCEAPKYINDKVVTSLRVCSADDTDAVYLAVNTPNDVFLYELNDKVRWTEVYNWRLKQCADLQWLATVGPVTELLFVEATKRHVILLGIYESALAERAILGFCCEPTALCVDEERNLICYDRSTNIVGVHSKLDFQRIRALTIVAHSQCALSAGSGNLAVLHRERKELRICKY